MGDFGLWDPLLYALMRSCMIKVGKVRFEDFMQLPFIENQQVIQAFSSNTPQEALTAGIRTWSLDWRS